MKRATLVFVCFLAACGGELGVQSEAIRRCVTGPIVRGIDVSRWDSNVDWAAVAKAGYPFGIAKATEGLTYRDPTFARNWSGMRAAGVVRSAYHFFHPGDDGALQADAFLAVTGAFEPGDLPPALDWEVTDGIDNATNVAQAQAFLDRIQEKTGLRAFVYTYPSYWSSLGTPSQFAAYPLWIANYGVSCPDVAAATWPGWTIWQDSSTATVAGLHPVDTNQFNGTMAQLLAMTVPRPVADAGALDAGSDAGAHADGGAHAVNQAGCNCRESSASAEIALVLLVFIAIGRIRGARSCSRTRRARRCV